MGKSFIRLISFFAKEVNEVRRQPILLAGLILGPFLILSLFGLGYTGERPTLRTALVVPEGRFSDEQLKDVIGRIGPTFQVQPEHVFTEEEPAMAALRQGRIDVVEVLPAAATDVYSSGQQLDVRITYNQIDPMLRDWIEYLAYAQITELNKGMLQSFIGSSQQSMGTLKEYVTDARADIAAIRKSMAGGNREQARTAIKQLRDNGALQLVAVGLAQQGDPDAARSAANLGAIQANLDALDRDLAAGGTLEQQEQRLAELDGQLAELDAVAERVRTVDPAVAVSPLRSKTANLAPLATPAEGEPAKASQDYVRFYTPAVLALLLQHMMVTLAALSLVRERLLGTIEVFRVSPISALQVLIGKYLGYTLLAAIILAALVPLMVFGLGLPFPLAQLGPFALLSLLVVVASLGWGF
ncbi:MAG TPA: ABC transporter permease, partial [Herpetosiphonaceae bacterium]